MKYEDQIRPKDPPNALISEALPLEIRVAEVNMRTLLHPSSWGRSEGSLPATCR
jgi:hypothetical protein